MFSEIQHDGYVYIIEFIVSNTFDSSCNIKWRFSKNGWARNSFFFLYIMNNDSKNHEL